MDVLKTTWRLSHPRTNTPRCAEQGANTAHSVARVQASGQTDASRKTMAASEPRAFRFDCEETPVGRSVRNNLAKTGHGCQHFFCLRGTGD